MKLAQKGSQIKTMELNFSKKNSELDEAGHLNTRVQQDLTKLRAKLKEVERENLTKDKKLLNLNTKLHQVMTAKGQVVDLGKDDHMQMSKVID